MFCIFTLYIELFEEEGNFFFFDDEKIAQEECLPFGLRLIVNLFITCSFELFEDKCLN